MTASRTASWRWRKRALRRGAGVVVCAAACTPAGDSSLEAAREHGLRAGFAVEPPYAFVDSAGVVTGEAPEILRWGAAALGISKVEWVPRDFPQLIPSLLDGRVDVIAAGLFITSGREEVIRFSPPTVCVAPVLVMREPGCDGCRIAVLAGSVEEGALRRAGGASELLAVPDIATGLAAVRSGGADGLAISGPTGRRVVEGNTNLVLEPAALPEEVIEAASGCAALGFRVDDEELTAAFDSVLRDFIGSPEHKRLGRQFGFTGAEIPCPSASLEGTGERADDCFRAAERKSAP